MVCFLFDILALVLFLFIGCDVALFVCLFALSWLFMDLLCCLYYCVIMMYLLGVCCCFKDCGLLMFGLAVYLLIFVVAIGCF